VRDRLLQWVRACYYIGFERDYPFKSWLARQVSA
jgi:hypothetical protein